MSNSWPEIDSAALLSWMRNDPQVAQAKALDGVEIGTEAKPVLPSVFFSPGSTPTYKVRLADREFSLHLPFPGSGEKGPRALRREYQILSGLAPIYPYVPQLIGYCEDLTVLGFEFYLVFRAPGVSVGRDFPDKLDLDILSTRELGERAIDALAELHQIDLVESGLDGLDRSEHYVRDQIEEWSARYRAIRTPDVPSFEPVMAWLQKNQPADSGHCIVHNDFRFANLVLRSERPTEIAAILGWATSRVGDPLLDLGNALAFWIEAQDNRPFRVLRHQPTNAMGMLTRRQALDHYCQRTGRELTVEQWQFYEIFGLFRLATLVQRRQSLAIPGFQMCPNPGQEWSSVLVLEQRCLRIMRGSGSERRVSRLAMRRAAGERLSVLGLLRRGHRAARDYARVYLPLARSGVTSGIKRGLVLLRYFRR